ncbi:MAG: 3'-5' exonuclease, partial [Myxococcota bacterium]|nr:3'-5' exonuclease [Myxococcota bacterium]
MSRYLRSLGEAVGELLGIVRPLLSAVPVRGKATQEVVDGLAWLEARLGEEAIPELGQLAEELADSLPKGRSARLGLWARLKFNKGESESFAARAGEVSAAADRTFRLLKSVYRFDPVLVGASRQLLAPMLEDVRERLRCRGLVGFSDLLRGAGRLLEARSDVCGRLRSEIDQLLVDEFQDTDPIQCALVGRLALEGPATERPGLFVVGDPKQSIYGWRSADLAAYENFLGRMERAGGEQLTLVANRRSRTKVLEEVDRVVGPVMSAEPGLQPAFQSLEAVREDAGADYGGPGAAIEYWISSLWDENEGAPAEKTRAGEATLIEARQIARDLCRLQAAGQSLSRVGILFRSTGDLDRYLDALRDFGVPYVVERDRSYFRRREVIDAISLVRSILEPTDQVALLGLLRSPWIGLPDAALIPLWCGGFPGRVASLEAPDPEALAALRTLLDGVADELHDLREVPGLAELGRWEDSVFEALLHIASLRAAWEELPADRFVEELRRRFLLEATEASRYLGGYRLANLERFFADLSLLLDEAAGLPQDLLRRLRTYLSDAREAEEARPDAPADDAVRIMTIHKSKGLDFDHVYIPQLHKQSGSAPPLGGIGTRTGAAQVAGEWNYEIFGSPSLGWAAVGERDEEVGRRERIRLLYVAMTRARDRLVLVGNWLVSGNAPSDPIEARSLLDLVRARRGGVPDISEAMSQLADAGSDRLDAQGVRWVFPVLDREDIQGLALPGPRPGPSPEEVFEEARLLARLRAEAAERMARPFGTAASAEAHRQLALERDESGEETVVSGPSRPKGFGAGVGTAVHRALEQIDLDYPPSAALAEQIDALPGYLACLVPAEQLPEAVEEATAVLSAFWEGALGERLRTLSEALVARELDFLASPGAGGGLGFVTGAIDLVYRDPCEGGRWVVADFKTDRVERPEVLAERVAAYTLQLRN